MLEKNKDRWVTTTFEEDEVIVHYKAFEVEFDEQSGIYWPYVPDVEQIKTAIEFYEKACECRNRKSKTSHYECTL
jgi:hypothetical protein